MFLSPKVSLFLCSFLSSLVVSPGYLYLLVLFLSSYLVLSNFSVPYCKASAPFFVFFCSHSSLMISHALSTSLSSLYLLSALSCHVSFVILSSGFDFSQISSLRSSRSRMMLFFLLLISHVLSGSILLFDFVSGFFVPRSELLLSLSFEYSPLTVFISFVAALYVGHLSQFDVTDCMARARYHVLPLIPLLFPHHLLLFLFHRAFWGFSTSDFYFLNVPHCCWRSVSLLIDWCCLGVLPCVHFYFFSRGSLGLPLPDSDPP